MKKRKTAPFGVFILVCVFMLTGCTSREERQKADEYEEKAEPYLTQYLSEHYPRYGICLAPCMPHDFLRTAIWI